jgi:hypothetical protein
MKASGPCYNRCPLSATDLFPTYQSRREYRRTCETAGKSGKQIERCVISSFQIAQSIGFQGDFRQWEIVDDNAGRRRKEAVSAALRKALHRAACAVKSQSGKRKRGMHLERSFEHVLEESGLRRATLRGTENLTKRHKIAAACFNLSLLMRTLLGVPKQWMAGANNLLEALIAYLCPRVLCFRSLCARMTPFILVLPILFRSRLAA